MALLASADSSELLDFLFDQNNGILTHDKYITNEFNEEFKTSDFGFNDLEADELLNCLTEADLLEGITQASYIEPCDSLFTNMEVSTNVTNPCHEDHIYSRSPDENTSGDSPNTPPSAFSALSYSYCDLSSPNGIELQDDCYSTSSMSSGINGLPSPLSGNMEDMSLAINGMYSSTIFVMHDNQLVEAVSSAGINRMVDNNGLVSLDIIESDVECYSDDESEGVESTFNGNDGSLFDDIGIQSAISGSQLPFTLHDLIGGSKKKLQKHHKLILSDEEKLLLAREGVSIPTDVPLTKEEERALKSVRRKIRNKVSAKVSRKRKQDYVEGLEKRVKICTKQNRHLQEKVEKLEKLNQSFLMQLKRLQAMISVPNGVTARHAQTGTCIMVLVMSFAFFVLPNVGPWLAPGQLQTSEKAVGPGRSRSLLANDMMLYTTHSDNDVDVGGLSDQLAAPITPPSLYNEVSVIDQQHVDKAIPDETIATAVESHLSENSSIIAQLGKDSVVFSAVQDELFTIGSDSDVMETVVDVTKFPPKNDL